MIHPTALHSISPMLLMVLLVLVLMVIIVPVLVVMSMRQLNVRFLKRIGMQSNNSFQTMLASEAEL